MYKIEPHLHTTHVSRCGQLEAQEIVAGYKAAGYSALIVTDHFNRTTFDYLTQELDIVPLTLDGNGIILHAVKFIFKSDKLVIMSSKKCLAAKRT